MNLIEAIKSERPFRRKGDIAWKWKAVDGNYFECNAGQISAFGPDDILADDWEIQEPTVTITRTQLLVAYAEVLKARNVQMCRPFGISPIGPADFHDGDIIKLARKLGLEDEK